MEVYSQWGVTLRLDLGSHLKWQGRPSCASNGVMGPYGDLIQSEAKGTGPLERMDGAVVRRKDGLITSFFRPTKRPCKDLWAAGLTVGLSANTFRSDLSKWRNCSCGPISLSCEWLSWWDVTRWATYRSRSQRLMLNIWVAESLQNIHHQEKNVVRKKNWFQVSGNNIRGNVSAAELITWIVL